ncbi:MAG: TRL-like family protein [Deltaproteobacteria bacterium]|nr:TRL-like family protein [Deltaproteobacteria bacterium]
MRKRINYLILVLCSTALLTGCAAVAMAPVMGLYTDVQAPYTATSNPSYSKVGTATCTSILGLIATGDASIETAAKNAGIKKIHHVDYNAKNILGIYAEYTVYVYGE